MLLSTLHIITFTIGPVFLSQLIHKYVCVCVCVCVWLLLLLLLLLLLFYVTV